MENLYLWLSNPRSFLHDPALLKKVRAYTKKAFEHTMSVLKRH